MKFADLMIGDWFAVSETPSATIWIKTGEFEGCPINHTCYTSVCDVMRGAVDNPDFEVNFCSCYVWADDTCGGEWNFGAYPNNLEPVNNFSEIPVGAVYKGRGRVYYRKISATEAVVIWTTNPATMGKKFGYKANQNGTYSICHFFNFSFPEMT